MNIFEFRFNEEDDEKKHGVFAMSIVNAPAMKSYHIALSDEEVHLKVQDDKKKILTGVALIPNKLITRIDKKTKEPYQAFFSAETIEKTSQRFLQDFNQSNITVEHMLSVDDVTVVESWIKTDEKLDKSVALGIDVPVGSWLMTLKVENDEVWDGLIETGLLNGFSIEGNFDRIPVDSEHLKEVKQNQKDMNKKDKTILQAIRNLFLGQETLVEADEHVDEIVDEEKDTVTYELSKEEAELIIKFREDKAEEVEEEETVEEVVEASEVVAETVEAVAPVETPEAVVETPAVVETVAEVVAEIKPEVAPQLIPHTDAEIVARKVRVKFNNKLTVQERIKVALGTLEV